MSPDIVKFPVGGGAGLMNAVVHKQQIPLALTRPALTESDPRPTAGGGGAWSVRFSSPRGEAHQEEVTHRLTLSLTL